MPAYVESGYGFGEAICKGSGFVRWGPEADCDAVVFLTMFFIPISPIKTIHTYNWNGKRCDAVPIRWSYRLVLAAMLRRWLIAPLMVGVFALIVAGINLLDPEGNPHLQLVLFLIGISCLVFSGAGYWILHRIDQRAQKIRWVLGPHEFGSSDPATWTEGQYESCLELKQWIGTDSYSQAVLSLLHARDFARAMWAARLTVLLENRDQGEELTDRILQHREVNDAIDRVRQNPQAWADVMNLPDPSAL